MSHDTFQKLIDLFTPHFETLNQRRTLIGSAFFGTDMTTKVQLEGAADEITTRTVRVLVQHGKIEPGTPAIIQLMQQVISNQRWNYLTSMSIARSDTIHYRTLFRKESRGRQNPLRFLWLIGMALLEHWLTQGNPIRVTFALPSPFLLAHCHFAAVE